MLPPVLHILPKGIAAATSLTVALATPAIVHSREPADLSGNEIVVTAQKYAQPVQDVPITISAITGERMEMLGVADLDELSSYIPGLNIQEQSANNPGIVIRGITSDSGSAQQGARVSVYYNGVDISRSRGAYQSLFDMDRVAVVKGPQATLFGTAATIGAISLISARPAPGTSAEMSGSIGNYDARRLSGFMNAGSDRFAGRLAFKWSGRDGYVNNLSPNQEEDLYAQDNLGVRTSLRFVPDENLTVDLIATYDRQRNGGTAFVSGDFPTRKGPPDAFGSANLGGALFSARDLGSDQLGLKRDVYDVNLTAQYDLSGGWEFTTVNGYRKFDSREVFDADGSAAPFLEFAEIAEGWQFNHEARFSYNSAHLRTSLGWNFFAEKGRQNVPFSTEEGLFLQCLLQVIPGLDCVAADGSVPALQATSLATGSASTQLPYRSVFENRGRNQSYSVFADTSWMPIETVELTAGLRLLWEDRRPGYFADVPVPVLPNLFPGPFTPSLIPGQVDTNGQTYSAKRSYFSALPRFNLLYRLSNDLNIYASVAKGRRSPVVQLRATVDGSGAAQPNLQLVPQEVVWNYEAGLKFNRAAFSGSLAVYLQDYSGFQVNVIQSNGSGRTESAGSAKNLGVEAEIYARPASWLSAFANGAYIDAKIDEDDALTTAFSGARFRLQPSWQAAAGFTIDMPIGKATRFFATPSITHRSRIYFELPNSKRISQSPVTLVNARAGISFDERAYEIAAYVRNATDKNYLLDAGNVGGAFGFPTFIPAEPRLYGLELTARLF